MSRTFDLGDILSITEGTLVSKRGMTGVHDILTYMSGDPLLAGMGLVYMADVCRPVLLAQHPSLVGIVYEGPATAEDSSAWLEEMIMVHGDEFEVQSLAEWETASI